MLFCILPCCLASYTCRIWQIGFQWSLGLSFIYLPIAYPDLIIQWIAKNDIKMGEYCSVDQYILISYSIYSLNKVRLLINYRWYNSYKYLNINNDLCFITYLWCNWYRIFLKKTIQLFYYFLPIFRMINVYPTCRFYQLKNILL